MSKETDVSKWQELTNISLQRGRPFDIISFA
jgi:hypothetical protein